MPAILLLLLKAWGIGIALASTPGPITMLIIKKTFEVGILGGISVVTGALLADIICGLIAASGLGIITQFLKVFSNWVHLISGGILLFFGIKELKALSTHNSISIQKNENFFKTVRFALVLNLSNPMVIILLLGILTNLGGENLDFIESLWIIFGLSLGIITYALIFIGILHHTGKYLSPNWTEKIKNGAAWILIILGGASIRPPAEPDYFFLS